jgi:hypothetical protein
VSLVSAAGARVLVLGSGWTRNVPDGWTRERAEAQLLPSIVAPGGSIFHFVADALGDDGLYEADFVLDDGPPAGDASLLSIDHVAMGVAPDRIDTWVLFCRALLGLESGDSLKLADRDAGGAEGASMPGHPPSGPRSAAQAPRSPRSRGRCASALHRS